MRTLVQNIDLSPFTMPLPLKGILAPGETAILSRDYEELRTILGASFDNGVLRVTTTALPIPLTDQFDSTVDMRGQDMNGLPPVPPTSTSAASRAYVDSVAAIRTRTLSSFDPGVGTPHRWNVAMTAALAAQQLEGFTLLIDGAFSFNQQIVIGAGTIMRGLPGHSVSFPTIGNAGFWLQVGAQQSTITDLYVLGPHPFAGQDDAFLVNGGRCTFARMAIANFGGTGFRNEGNFQVGTNANENRYADIQFGLIGNGTQNGKNGAMYFAGGDSNGCLVSACHANDCRRGFYDNSFLGNVFIGCSAEGCNDRFTKPPQDPTVGYGFVSVGVSSRMSMLGCYVEQDSECDVNVPASIIGGLIGAARGNTPILFSWGNGSFFGAANPTGALTQIGSGNAGYPVDAMLSMQAPGGHATYFVYNRPGRAGWYSMNMANLDIGDIIRWKETQNAGPDIWFPTDVTYSPAGVKVGWGTPGAGPTNMLDAWGVGDRLMHPSPGVGDVWGWVCTQAGSAATAVWKALGTVAP